MYTIQQKKVSTKARLYEPQIIREEDVGLFRTNPQIEDSLRYNTFQASDTTLARVTENITNNLVDSYHEGFGIRDAGRKINKEFTRLKGWETRRIARTEINTAQNEGAFSAYDELGVEYHMWWTGNDNRVRDSHRPLHGHIVAVGNTFSNGLLFPGDKSGPLKEWINCRCTTVPFIIPLGKMAPPGLSEFTEDQLIDIPGYMPISVEDALNGEYPLDYYQADGMIDQYRMESPYRQLKNAIADELKGFIPDEDIEMLSSEFAKYKLQTDKLKFETMSAWDSEGKQVLNNYTDYLDTRIMRNEHFEDILEEKGLKLSIHNHPQGHSPIPSGIDVNKMTKTEYGLTATTDNGLIVMKLENGEYTADRISLRNAMNSFNNRLQEDFKREESKYYNKIRKAYESNKITKEQKGIALTARYQKYLVRNVERYSKELDKVLSGYGIRVKYISKDKLPKIDNYKQKQKYTILDNFNEPFKEAYGAQRFEDNISNKLKFTEKELNEYRKLKAQKKAGKLKDSSKKRKLRKYEQQLQFNKYYEKYGNKLPNDPVDAGIYKNLVNLTHIKKKIGKSSDEFFKIEKTKSPKLVTNKQIPKNNNNEADLKNTLYKKDPNKVVEINGKCAYGISEEISEKNKFGKEMGIKDYELTSDELKFIKLFSDDGFSSLNTYMRKVKGVWNPFERRRLKKYWSKEWDKSMKSNENYMPMDKAIKIGKNLYKKAKVLEDDLVVVRRQHSPMTKYSTNGVYINDGFLSTSISGDITKYGVYKNYIRIPKGEKIIYIECVTSAEFEYEVLLPPGVKINMVEEVNPKLIKWSM